MRWSGPTSLSTTGWLIRRCWTMRRPPPSASSRARPGASRN
ncbi:hypothetical protein GBAR_LOCUS26240 [Geodia barretti]|uniref:Uncharacterized protein n=1 Tax=Geodia barretti TaxID=519541 RepID=A0AA35TI23_GEOBA|nr:hypothetical protein GBAR_LOCUS26240 [Geodia barretti]